MVTPRKLAGRIRITGIIEELKNNNKNKRIARRIKTHLYESKRKNFMSRGNMRFATVLKQKKLAYR